MSLAHSRRPSWPAPRCPPRITVVVIRSAVNAAMSQARTSCNVSLEMQVRKLSKLSYQGLFSRPESVMSLCQKPIVAGREFLPELLPGQIP